MRTALFLVLVFVGASKLQAQVNEADSVSFRTTEVDSVRVTLADTNRLQPEFVVYSDSGIASWYGKSWQGRLTASGEYFSPDSMTAAHKWLPFGTIVKVTNTANDSVVYVRITDRLPKKSKRTIDLSPVAARKLGFYSKGLQKVRIETCGMIPVRKKKISCGPGAVTEK